MKIFKFIYGGLNMMSITFFLLLWSGVKINPVMLVVWTLQLICTVLWLAFNLNQDEPTWCDGCKRFSSGKYCPFCGGGG